VDGTRLDHLGRGVAVDLGSDGLSARIGAQPRGICRSRKPASACQPPPSDAEAS